MRPLRSGEYITEYGSLKYLLGEHFFCGLLYVIGCFLILHWGMASSGACGHCGYQVENALHILRDCSIARKVWGHFETARNSPTFFTDELSTWLSSNLHESKDSRWKVTFVVTLWRLWTWRCKVSIGAEVLNWDEASFIQNIRLTGSF